jgi:hypothetical protein
MFKYAGKIATGALSVTAISRLGPPALAAIVFLAVLVLGVVCWVISDDARVNRITRILAAMHGNILPPEPGVPPVLLPGPQRRLRLKKR